MASTVTLIGGLIWQRIWLDDEHDRHDAVESTDHLSERIDVGRLVLVEAISAICSWVLLVETVVAHLALGAANILAIVAADLPIRCQGEAVPVWQIVHDEGDEVWRVAKRSILQDALHSGQVGM